ncbi:MAG: fatty acid desaturase [Pseudomonadota bacterium]
MRTVEWPTLVLLGACYGLWLAATAVFPGFSLGLAVAVSALTIALHSSLTHEIVHGHPFPGRPRLNEALVSATLNLFIPLGRFRDTHMAHHNDAVLTDPYDDPESNYLDPAVWARLPWLLRALLSFNNTLFGRLTIGPAVSLAVFYAGDIRAAIAGERDVARAWIWHIPQAGVVLGYIALSPMPIWAYVAACYGGMAILKIRTFLEHQAHDRASGRTAIVEDRGPLGFLFLNNNLHVVHHMHPGVPWYALPALYRSNRAHYVRRNGGYVFRSYGEVFARHFLRRKDPVPHPLYRD